MSYLSKYKEGLQLKSKRQNKVKNANIESGPSPEYPLPIHFKDVRVEIFVFRYEAYETPTMQHYKWLDCKEKKRQDQYWMWANGKKLYLNKQGKVVMNAKSKKFITGIYGALRFMGEHLVRVGRFDEY